MVTPHDGSVFSDVDGSGDADAAARFLDSAAERAAETRRRSYPLLQLSAGSSVLDVGCGLGEVCADLAEVVAPNGTVIGIDLSAELLDRARERWADLAVRFELGHAQALRFEDATFDAVRAERVVQHLEQPAIAISEMARVLRPQGRVFVLDAVHDAMVVATGQPLVWEKIRAHGLGAVRQPRAGLYLKEWMQAAGLTVQIDALSGVGVGWPVARSLMRVDDGIARAVESGAITREQADDFIAEQQDRENRGVFAMSVLFVQAIGIKDA